MTTEHTVGESVSSETRLNLFDQSSLKDLSVLFDEPQKYTDKVSSYNCISFLSTSIYSWT